MEIMELIAKLGEQVREKKLWYSKMGYHLEHFLSSPYPESQKYYWEALKEALQEKALQSA